MRDVAGYRIVTGDVIDTGPNSPKRLLDLIPSVGYYSSASSRREQLLQKVREELQELRGEVSPQLKKAGEMPATNGSSIDSQDYLDNLAYLTNPLLKRYVRDFFPLLSGELENRNPDFYSRLDIKTLRYIPNTLADVRELYKRLDSLVLLNDRARRAYSRLELGDLANPEPEADLETSLIREETGLSNLVGIPGSVVNKRITKKDESALKKRTYRLRTDEEAVLEYERLVEDYERKHKKPLTRGTFPKADIGLYSYFYRHNYLMRIVPREKRSLTNRKAISAYRRLAREYKREHGIPLTRTAFSDLDGYLYAYFHTYGLINIVPKKSECKVQL